MFYLILSGKFTFNKLGNKHMSILAIYKNRFVKVSIVLWIQVLGNIERGINYIVILLNTWCSLWSTLRFTKSLMATFTILSKKSRVDWGSDNISLIPDENTKMWFETGQIKFLSILARRIFFYSRDKTSRALSGTHSTLFPMNTEGNMVILGISWLVLLLFVVCSWVYRVYVKLIAGICTGWAW